VTRKLGKLPAQPGRPQLRLADYTSTIPSPPTSVTWFDLVRQWPMFLNDQLGDCVEAAMGHAVEQITMYGQGQLVTVSDSDIQASYTSITGYDPSDPSTDQGTYMQDAMAWWRKTGLISHKIEAYASVTPSNLNLLKNCVNFFGSVPIGFNFPSSAMDQFDDGEPWDVVDGAALEGGHCVLVVGYDTDFLYVVTWGRVQKMTWRFYQKYTDEVWVVIDDEMVNKLTHASGFGGAIDLHTMGEDFSSLTGKANPFPDVDPTPAPVPAPPPTPTPVPVVDEKGAGDALWHDIRHWAVQEHHTGDNKRAATSSRNWARLTGRR